MNFVPSHFLTDGELAQVREIEQMIPKAKDDKELLSYERQLLAIGQKALDRFRNNSLTLFPQQNPS